MIISREVQYENGHFVHGGTYNIRDLNGEEIDEIIRGLRQLKDRDLSLRMLTILDSLRNN